MEKSNQIQKIPKMSILAAVLLILIWIDQVIRKCIEEFCFFVVISGRAAVLLILTWIDQVIRKCFEDEDFCSFVVIPGILFVSTAIVSFILVRKKFKSSVSNQANLAVNQNGLNQCICKLYHFNIK